MARKFLREAQLICRDGEPLLVDSLEGVRSVGAVKRCQFKAGTACEWTAAPQFQKLTGIFPKPFFGSGKKRAHFLVRCLIEDAVCLAN
jgi:hypothetical protein